ncbi:hypothetical protein F7725_018636 [Dissostichus mawsoni]|uniref:Ig-like domain-containing protein n=1 Tax=Dissostichus mawsoni TaxID=36200 RepID=A0A7J5XTV5_DISMA|nr:hypothetical protein F7725_018636 [Dissostichus mawsoni]
MRKEGVQYWIQHLGELKDEGLFTGDFLDKALVQLCFMAIIQEDLNEIRHVWNAHRIRPSTNAMSPQEYLISCIRHLICGDDLPTCKESCKFLTSIPCDEDVFDLCTIIMEESGMGTGASPETNLCRSLNSTQTVVREVFKGQTTLSFIGYEHPCVYWRMESQCCKRARGTGHILCCCSLFIHHPGPNLPTSKIRGIWHQSNNRGDLIYDEDETNISENFRGRTKLLGHLGQKNCTLEMSEIKDHDNGPFCFRIELLQKRTSPEKFSFLEDCVEFKMLPDPPKPKLHHPKTAYQGRPYTVTCSVKHTCPYDPPKLTWSRSTADVPNVVHKETHLGNWEVESILTIIPEEKDDHTDITCTANFNGLKTSSATLTLYVKRSTNYNHIIIPTVVAIGTAKVYVEQIFEVCLNINKMSGFRHSLLSFGILGYIFVQGLWAWHVKIPRNIKGLSGSCLVIPCTFDYYEYPPLRPDRVVWYQYKNKGYPLVYDNWYKDSVIKIFKDRTRVFTSKYKKTCTLEIYPVNQYHHQQKLYPWVDPENVGKTTFRFYDTTVTIEVVDWAATPYIMISGSMKVGQSVTVQCYVYHTCSTYPPTLSLNIPLQSPSLAHVSMTDGTSRTTLTTTLNIERDHQTVECSVRHVSGSFLPLTISQTSEEFLEGQPRTVTCTASYTCPKHLPTLSWNYGNMPTTTVNSQIRLASWSTVSSLTFTASSNDHGRSLTCYARFIGGRCRKRASPYVITGMKGSCIVIPCTFTYSFSQPADLKVAWYLYQSNGYPSVYEQRRNVINKYQA